MSRRRSRIPGTRTLFVLPPIDEGVPPPLSLIELLWSLEPSETSDALLPVVAAAIGDYGGFNAIKESFHQDDYCPVLFDPEEESA